MSLSKAYVALVFGLVYFFVSGSLIAASSTMEAQRDAPSLGLQAGLNFETATTPSQISSDTRTGFSLGVNVEVPLSANFAIQPEVNYSRRGLDLVTAGGAKATVNYHALEVPVFAKVSLGEKIRPFVFAGPMAVWNISSDVTGSFGGTSTTASFNPKSFDFAAVGGVGLEVASLFVDARYVLGITDINQNSAEWKSRGFRLMAGVRL